MNDALIPVAVQAVQVHDRDGEGRGAHADVATALQGRREAAIERYPAGGGGGGGAGTLAETALRDTSPGQARPTRAAAAAAADACFATVKLLGYAAGSGVMAKARLQTRRRPTSTHNLQGRTPKGTRAGDLGRRCTLGRCLRARNSRR